MLYQILDLPLDIVRRISTLMTRLQKSTARTSHTTTMTLTTTLPARTALNEMLNISTAPSALA
jgi:hypothetical protein